MSVCQCINEIAQFVQGLEAPCVWPLRHIDGLLRLWIMQSANSSPSIDAASNPTTNPSSSSSTVVVPRLPLPEWVDEPSCQDESQLCRICLDRARCVIMEPCHHRSTCVRCTRTLMSQSPAGGCPICRQAISGAFRSFDS